MYAPPPPFPCPPTSSLCRFLSGLYLYAGHRNTSALPEGYLKYLNPSGTWARDLTLGLLLYVDHIVCVCVCMHMRTRARDQPGHALLVIFCSRCSGVKRMIVDIYVHLTNY